MHLHLDLVGGMSGDMFISALLDCFPEHFNELEQTISDAGFPDLVRLTNEAHNDGILTGHRFHVFENTPHTSDHSSDQPTHDHHHEHSHEHSHDHAHSHSHSHSHSHGHRHYREIKQLITESRLEDGIKQITLSIFEIIAIAEAQIHGKPVDTIAFHEVGAWDSIADIVCASALIHKLQITSTSCSPLPLGRGQVKTAHGMLPVPAPATALILEGFNFVDDGIDGERITPTGAAILKYLDPSQHPSGSLRHQGYGFGTKVFPEISNVLRAMLFETHQSAEWNTETIHQFECEIDDQTPEQLAAAVESIRSLDGVLDVSEYIVHGKKNRLSHSLRILSNGTEIENLISKCFASTTTLGLRHSEVKRYTLNRQHSNTTLGEQSFRLKTVDRPGGPTSKVEMDDLSGKSVAEQNHIRQQLE